MFTLLCINTQDCT